MGFYGTTVRMNGFLGLNQDGDGIGMDPRYALEAVNVTTEGGVLACAARSIPLRAELTQPIGTLMRLYRRWHTDDGSRVILVASSGGRLYWMREQDSAWSAVQMPEGIELFESDRWSFVTYEINPEGSSAPVDVLLLSNAKDGMFCVRGDTMAAEAIGTPKKFGVIARYAERIWGGAILGDPDMLVYSAPFDPFNWAANHEIPEDGAGDVAQPSWDGDSFTALTQFGAQLIALKRNRVWRILGTDPGQYVFREQYGGGAIFADTVAVAGERILMLGRDGLLAYDGLSVAPFGQPYAKKVFERMHEPALWAACACVYKECYYCALPLDGSPMNNAVLVLDLRAQTWLLRQGLSVQAFLPTEEALYYTSATVPGQVHRIGEDVQISGAATPTTWIGPWQELGVKDALKGGWTVGLTVEAPSPMELLITIRTEKKARTKTLKVKPGARQRKLIFGGSGRRWRLEIACMDAVPWRIVGGVQVDVEMDFV